LARRQSLQCRGETDGEVNTVEAGVGVTFYRRIAVDSTGRTCQSSILFTHPMIEHILSKLPTAVRDSRHSLQDIGLPDLAWSLDQIDDVLIAVRERNIAVLGGDIYEDQDGRTRVTYDNWYVNREPNESFEEYAHRTIERAREYARAYPRKVGRVFYVGLVMSDDPTTGIR
jgi:hypothetical protein